MSRSAASKMYADDIKITSATPGLNDVVVERGGAGRFMVNNLSLNKETVRFEDENDHEYEF